MNIYDPTRPLTAYALAKQLGRTQPSLHAFIRRHGITPCAVEARGSLHRSLYPPETLELARASMREPNGSRRKASRKAPSPAPQT